MRTRLTTPTRAPRDTCSPRHRGRAATPRRVTVGLTPQAVEQVAQRVTQLLRYDKRHGQPELITAGELAHRLRVQRSWIYKNRHLLDGERLGDGPKAEWRFDPDRAMAALAKHRAARVGEGEA
jgi:hypothetical protein